MRRVVLTYILWAFCPLFINAAVEWTPAVERLKRSAVYLENTDGSCTAFVINAAAREKKDRDFLLTAAHCDGEKLYADHVPATVIFKDAKKDLMVIETDNLERPALKLAAKNPDTGDEVASYGYGMGLERSMFRIAHVSDTAMYIPEEGIGGPFIVIDAAFVGGQSGGPVVNTSGEVVLIVQRGSNTVGIGVGAELIREAVGRFWEK